MNEAPRDEDLVRTARAGVDGERRERIGRTIRELVSERQQVLVYYWDLTELLESDELSDSQLAEQLKEFCQLLVDYTALGHFEIYQRVVEGNERRADVRDAADQIYPTIAETTDVLVDFNDKYDSNEAPDSRQVFASDLARVGKALSVRIDLEDQILDALGGGGRQ